MRVVSLCAACTLLLTASQLGSTLHHKQHTRSQNMTQQTKHDTPQQPISTKQSGETICEMSCELFENPQYERSQLLRHLTCPSGPPNILPACVIMEVSNTQIVKNPTSHGSADPGQGTLELRTTAKEIKHLDAGPCQSFTAACAQPAGNETPRHPKSCPGEKRNADRNVTAITSTLPRVVVPCSRLLGR